MSDRRRIVRADARLRRAHADRLLAERSTGWKFVTSLWTLGVFAGLGCASVLGWWIVVNLTHARRYWWIASIYTVIVVIAVVIFAFGFDENDEQINVLADVGGFGFLGVWIVSSIHAIFEIKPVLRERVLRLAGGTPDVRVRVVEHRAGGTEHDDYLAQKARRAGADLGEFYDADRGPTTEDDTESPSAGQRPDDDPPGRRLDV